MRRGTVLILIWLMIGAAAAGQRGYFDAKSSVGCTQAATIALTMITGPLNYLGVDAKWSCKTPMPSN
jgi:hypothetical protein